MSVHVVIGTAGHVDHGKTALVKALTGTDTDRWEEEKRRGITIDLGFAELVLGDDLHAGIVDVPGHEDFVRNMVAGATGIDVALLVVAADEGIMPQTEEHLAVLELLGVQTGIAAVTKTDLVAEDWLTLVIDDLRERLDRSATAWHDIVPVSSVSGAGLADLRAALVTAAGGAREREGADMFRLPVDRVFTVAGTGTVVTGTTWSGSAAVGQDVVILPGGQRARVRGIQVHGRSVDAVVPGRRTALALSGIDRAGVSRGSWVVHAAGWRETSVVDGVATLLAGAPPLSQRTRVRVHLGTAEVMARVTPAAAPPGGAAGTVRLRLEAPVVARWGDRAVLRSYSPATTIGGVVITDPWPPPRPRRPHPAESLLGEPVTRLRALLERETAGIPRAHLPVRLGIREDVLPAVLDAAHAGAVIPVGARLMAGGRVDAVRSAVLDMLTRFHEAQPLEDGMAREAVRNRVGDAELADHVERELVREERIVVDGARVRLAEHRARVTPAQAAAAASVRNALKNAGFEGCTVSDLARSAGIEPASALDLVEFLVRDGPAARVGRNRYYDRDALGEMVDVACKELAQTGRLTPAQLREGLGLTRKFLIPFLEWLDAEGYTARVGDGRRPGPRLTKTSGKP